MAGVKYVEMGEHMSHMYPRYPPYVTYGGYLGKMNGEKYREILNENLLRTYRTSSRTTTLSTQPRQQRSGFGTCP
jgi:hypothetical protein